MIKASELRLGNLISHNGEHVPVVQIERRYKTIFRINDIDVDERIIEDTYQPILLTPEWLERCGYKKDSTDKKWYKSPHNLPPIYQWRPGSFGMDGLPLAAKSIEYVHQLQNLYHALTGEELNITL